MQVSCTQCGAQYEFDASAIPAEGYDAQCTTCNNIFFVAPEGGAAGPQPAALATTSELVAVACGHCGAVYQFAATDIPSTGYDAQCTQCQSIFFVSPANVTPAAVAAAFEVPASTAVDVQIPPTPPMAPAPQTAVMPVVGPAVPPPLEEVPEVPAADFATMSEFMRSPSTVSATTTTTELDLASTGPLPIAADPLAPFPVLANAPLSEVTSQHTVPDMNMFSPGEPASAFTPSGGPGALSAAAASPAVSPHDAPTTEVTLTPEQRRGFQPEALDAGTMEVGYAEIEEVEAEEEEPQGLDVPPQPLPAAALPAPPRPSLAPATVVSGESSDMMALDAELGDPLGEQPSSTVEEEAEEIVQHHRRRRMKIVAAVAVACVVLVVGLMQVPRLFDATLGRVVGAKRPPDPQAVVQFEAGRTAMLQDTDDNYVAASKYFTQAVKIDPFYADAFAWGALAHAFRGMDVMAQGNDMWRLVQKEQSELRGLQQAQRTINSTALAARIEDLKTKVREHLGQSTDLFENGGRELSFAWKMVQSGRRAQPHAAIVADAAAICYTSEPDTRLKADKMLERSAELRKGTDGAPANAPPSDLWLAFAQGVLESTDRGGADKALASFKQALKDEPHLQRARWALARSLAHSGQKNDAKSLIDEILADVPSHLKAKSLLAEMAAPAEPKPGLYAAEPAAHEPSARALKGKKHRAKKK